MAKREPATYAAAGVDIEAGDAVVDRIAEVVASTKREGVLGGIGGFGGLFALDTDRYQSPVLVASTDGVGTKLEVARLMDRYDTIGIDLVAMCVDDLVCVGAEPLFLLDYIAVGAVEPNRIADVVAGIAQGCRQARCALLGGETAEHGGVMKVDDLDVAGFSLGVVERGRELGSHRVAAGNVLIGIGSPNLRSNGFTLARHVLLERAGMGLDEIVTGNRSLGDLLLEPSIIYAATIVDLLRGLPHAVNAIAHITGGGIPGNLIRVLPEGLGANVDRSGLSIPTIFEMIATQGPVESAEMDRVFNMGVGMILCVEPDEVTSVLAHLEAASLLAAEIGSIEVGERRVVMA
jgi:phosphoribosylformylglycinamidine cyclo-ligase